MKIANVELIGSCKILKPEVEARDKKYCVFETLLETAHLNIGNSGFKVFFAPGWEITKKVK